MTIHKSIRDHIAANLGQTRRQICEALGFEPVATSNALANLKADGQLFCTFKGRHSVWSAQKPEAKPVANSVWRWAA